VPETAAAVPPPPPSVCNGWVWKGATGRRWFGRSSWKLRFIHSNVQQIEYYASEPFDHPKGVVPWDSVSFVYDNITPAVYGGIRNAASATSSSSTSSSASPSAATGSSSSGGGADPPVPLEAAYFHFGVRFSTGEGKNLKEYVLCFRTDRSEERDRWLEHFHFAFKENARLNEVMVQDDEEKILQQQLRGAGFMEKFRLMLRNAVSLKKQRFVKDGIDLDLAYILPSVIAMGYPAEGKESLFRNPMEQVVWFFEKYHKDSYRIYNLCSERSYPANRFNGCFARYPFDDHNACPMEMLLAICEDIHDFVTKRSHPSLMSSAKSALDAPLDLLQQRNGNVVAIHCKAGKGRTGLVICCYLLYAGICATAEEALKLFGDRRTKDGKGVQIPSQKRYIGYFEQLLYLYHGYIPATRLIVQSLTLSTTPRFDADGGSDPFVIAYKRREDHHHRFIDKDEGNFANPYVSIFDSRSSGKPKHIVNVLNYSIDMNVDLGEVDDVRFTLLDLDINRNEHMCAFWVHAGFLDTSGTITIPKTMIDDAVKDKDHKEFTEDFCVTLKYTLKPTQKPSDALPMGPRKPIPALTRLRNSAEQLNGGKVTVGSSSPPHAATSNNDRRTATPSSGGVEDASSFPSSSRELSAGRPTAVTFLLDDGDV
jgi:phosphatidylinositol-3,4,5-trisphosphate 3-phosphatase/dual-specificity protein phosphatase PTEN